MTIRTKRIISAMLSLIMAFGMLFAVSGQAAYADQNNDILDSLGEYTEQAVDFSIKNENAEFDFIRTYHSKSNKWFFSINSNIALASNELDYVLKTFEGEEITLTNDNTGNYTDDNEEYSMTLNAIENKATIVNNEISYIYSTTDGKLIQIKDINNNALNFTYDVENGQNYVEIGFAKTYTDYNNISQTISNNCKIYFDSRGRIDKAYTTNGDQIKYSFFLDFLYNVKFVHNEIEYTRNDDILLAEYTYNNDIRVKTANKSEIIYENDRVKTIKNQTGEITASYVYDVKTFNSYGVETATSDFTVYEVKKNDDIYVYNADKELILTIIEDTATIYDYSQNEVEERHYNYDGNEYTLIESEETESNENTTYTYYDTEHKHIHTETTTETEDDNEIVTVNTYSNIGTLLSTEVNTSENNTVIKNEKDTYKYDGCGYMAYHKNRLTEGGTTVNHTWEYENRADGRTTKITETYDGSTKYTYYKYDPLGNELYKKENNKVTRKIYDEYSRLVQEIEPEQYDQSSDGIINGADYYTDSDNGHRYYYNSSTGNLTTKINALGVVTNYTYFPNSTKVATETFDEYEYSYNQLGEPLEIKVADFTYAEYNYNNTTGYLDSIDYGNDQSVLYTYNNNGKVTKQEFKEDINATPVTQFEYTYDNDGELATKIDHNANQKTVYGENNLVTVYAPKNAQETSENEVYSYYDREEKTETVTDPDTQEETEVTTPATSGRTYGSTSLVTTFTDNTANIKLNNADYLTVETVENERQKKESKEVKNASDTRVLKTEYTYDDDGNAVASTITGLNNYETSTQYSYDDKGRLTAYTQQFADLTDPFHLSYAYSNNLLSRENIDLGGFQKTYTYSYDSRGNYKKLKEYDYTTGEITEGATNTELVDLDYESGIWLDDVSSVNGTEIVYDYMGNPVYLEDCSFEWTNGRQLRAIINDNTNEEIISYTYDENGIRTSKTYGTTTIYYTNVNGQITSQYEISHGEKIDEILFIYDGDDLIGAKYGSRTYYYVKNIFGDVTAVLNEQGQSVVDYSYTAWGQMLVEYKHRNNDIAHFADINPMKYRSYYYDSEIDMYYLQSRYYWLPICRFFNADLPEYAKIQRDETAGTNLFAYCNNDPVNHSDPTGKIAVKLISVAVAAIIAGVFDYIVQGIVYQFKHKGKINGFRINTKSLIVSIVQGAASGLLMSTRYKKLIQGIGSGIIAAVGTAVKMYKTTKFSNILKSALIDFAIAAIISLMCGHGIGTKFWSKDFKNLFGKGQYIYHGVILSNGKTGILITGSLALVKPVVKELCKSLFKYLIGNIAYSAQSALRTIFKGK